MNILKRELRANLKPFLFWTLGLFVLAFAGMTKYTGIESGGVDIYTIMAQFPKIVQALMGLAGVDANTLGGYFAVISYFAAICASLYAISLGFGAVSREAVDKTYEFLFTKPRTRAYILSRKLLAGFIFLSIFSLLYYVFSVGAIALLNLKDGIGAQVVLFTVSLYLVSLVFFSLSAFLSALARVTEKGARWGNYVFIFAFVMGVICDMMDRPGVLRLLSPLKYFVSSDLLVKSFSAPYTVLCALIIAACVIGAFRVFRKKDLSAV